jgi:hypothetical protein
MKTKTYITTLNATFLFVLVFIPSILFAQIPKDGGIYIHPELGNNINAGTKENPVRS